MVLSGSPADLAKANDGNGTLLLLDVVRPRGDEDIVVDVDVDVGLGVFLLVAPAMACGLAVEMFALYCSGLAYDEMCILLFLF